MLATIFDLQNVCLKSWINVKLQSDMTKLFSESLAGRIHQCERRISYDDHDFLYRGEKNQGETRDGSVGRFGLIILWHYWIFIRIQYGPNLHNIILSNSLIILYIQKFLLNFSIWDYNSGHQFPCDNIARTWHMHLEHCPQIQLFLSC